MVRAIMIVESAGQPAEHVKEFLTNHIGVLQQVKDVTIHSINISEPREMEESKGIYTCFAEADFSIPSFSRLSETVFDFMPASVEIIEPGKVTMDLSEASTLLNNISGRMHRYDELAKVAYFKIKKLTQELQQHEQKKEEEPTKKKKTKNS